MLIFWIIVFILSLALLVKGADWLISSSEKIGLSLGLSPFIVGVTIVGVGTSFPELISSFAAAIRGLTDVVAANVIGSNIANILLIIGLSAILAKKLEVTKNLIDLDLPLLAISTVILLGVVWDKEITLGESILMLATYIVYLLYTINEESDETGGGNIQTATPRPKTEIKDILLLIAGLAGLVLGAKYLIDALVQLSTILNIATGVIAITAVAVGTSLPELLVSAKAAMQKKSEVALGNIFGSNIFNGLVVTGLPGLFRTLAVDEQTFSIGAPTLAATTLIFVISGISRRVHAWEGAFYISLYTLFVAKLFNWF